MKKQNELKISEEDLKFIMGEDHNKYFNKIMKSYYCSNCDSRKDISKIIDYEIFINDIEDVILRGYCEECGNRVNRYMETGEGKEYVARIEKIKKKYAKN